MKKREKNGISKEYFILSVKHFIAKIWDLKVWEKHFFHKIGSCTKLLHCKFASKSWFKFKKSWNMKRRERNGVSKKYIFFLSDISLQRYDSTNRRPILEKTLFHTVGICTLWPKQLTCLADGGGWREDQHMWDGQGWKDPCFFITFFRITKS